MFLTKAPNVENHKITKGEVAIKGKLGNLR